MRQLQRAVVILARAGSKAEVESELSEHSACKVEATVDPATKTATYSVVVTQAGATIAEHKARVTIE